MTRVVRAAEMRACDAAAMQAGTPQAELMERAAGRLAAAVLRVREGTDLPVVFLCGRGNNGGDGRIAAEKLAALSPLVVDAEQGLPALPARFLAVDCVFGTGFHGKIPERMAPVFRAMAGAERVVACDIPSGLDADSGIADPMTPRASETVTFAAAKYGQYFGSGPDLCGRLEVADIGIPIVTPSSALADAALVKKFFPKRPKNCHKRRVFGLGGHLCAGGGGFAFRRGLCDRPLSPGAPQSRVPGGHSALLRGGPARL